MKSGSEIYCNSFCDEQFAEAAIDAHMRKLQSQYAYVRIQSVCVIQKQAVCGLELSYAVVFDVRELSVSRELHSS